MKSEVKALPGCHADDLESNLHKVKIIRGMFLGIALIIPTMVAYWQQAGLGMTEMLLLEAICAWTWVAAEVPSGYFADCIGRKVSIISGGALCCISLLIYGSTDSYTGFMIGEIIVGLGIAMISGADEALFADTLAELGRKHEYGRLWGQVKKTEICAGAIGFAIGGTIAALDPGLPFAAGACILVMQMLVASRLLEPGRGESAIPGGSLKELVHIARRSALHNAGTRRVYLLSALVAATLQVPFWLYQPYLAACGIPLAMNGLVMAALVSVSIPVASRAKQIECGGGIHLWTVIILLAIGVSMVSMSSTVLIVGPLFIVLQQLARGVFAVAYSGYLQQQIDSGTRATETSLKSMFEKLLSGTLMIPAGWLVDTQGIQSAHLVIGLINLTVVAVLLLLFRKQIVLSLEKLARIRKRKKRGR